MSNGGPDRVGPIQTVPQGFLGLLQLKELGRNPGNLLMEVAPNLELFPFLAQRLISDLVQGAGGGAPDTINVPTASPGAKTFATSVPPNETWWVERQTVSCALLAAETMIMAPAMLSGAPAGIMYLTAPAVADVVTARARQLRISTAYPGFWAAPQSTFGVFVYDDLTAGNITITLGLRGFRVPI